MKLCRTFGLLLFIGVAGYSQDIKPIVIDTTSHWEKKNTLSFDLSEIAFVNWNPGGTSSVSGLAKGIFFRKYEKDQTKWSNELIMRYGMNKQDGVEWRKTDDAFQFNSTFGYRRDTVSHWYHSAKLTFNTQFSNGYNYPNTAQPISKPFAPAYTFLGVGAEYSNKAKKVNFYLSPLTMKNTLVLDQRLANQGAFGVDKAVYDDVTGEILKKGKQARTELGILITGHHKHELWKNITLEDRISLYTDYLNKFGNVDIDWQMQMDFVVNEYVKASIGTQLVYDDDIKAKEERDGEQVTVGPKIQLKQILGIGLVYNFQ
ncbi:DUF3078 domain-containing protein [Flavobacterium sp. MAH-1]|uniref:DUF3078 domain-containing protein n=1 Tax=Flavobacterium agri TaxID=2743471 RepID=A0A7Y9C6L9_9FLAO|nr:DUF3078 domain-containing protein [Flavobacterium agri]NUY81545.1 DUF3078 domain-containing protein [Flavobacterium agri]NYA71569.1 DUF3078 domain-containing protein [Flavobacterium agri]